jgi:Protein of unknown function (DUF4231)
MAGDSYRIWLKKELGSLIDALALTDLEKRFLRSRWLDQVVWLEAKAKQNQWRYYCLRVLTITAGVVVPALVSLNVRKQSVASTLAWITFAVSLVVAIAAALEGFFRYGDRWRNYRRSAEALKAQGWQFFQLAGPYSAFKSHSQAYPVFAAQVEALLYQDVDVYITQVVQEQARKETGGEGGSSSAEGAPGADGAERQ